MLPEKWCVRTSNQKIVDYCNENGVYKDYRLNCNFYAHFPAFDKCTTSLSIQPGYTEITLETFEKYVLKEKYYTIKDLSEGKVALEFNQNIDKMEDLDRVIFEAFPDDPTIPSKWSWMCKYYMTQEMPNMWNLSDQTIKPTQPLKNFLNMKLIGYKLVKPEFAKAACMIEGHYSFGESIKDGHTITLINREDAFKKLKEANVLDLWFEPVYEEEFKVGDYCMCICDGGNGIGFMKGEGEHLIQIVDNSFSSVASGLIESDPWNFIVRDLSQDSPQYRRINAEKAKLRRATRQEIDENSKIQLIGSVYLIVTEKNKATIANYTFQKEFWEAAKIVAEHSKADVIVGCGAKESIGNLNQWKLDLETIKKVLAKIC